MRKARGKIACARHLADLGPDGGLWSWKSSPHVLWLANQLRGSAA